jgi:hypothetical protein
MQTIATSTAQTVLDLLMLQTSSIGGEIMIGAALLRLIP